MEFNVFDYRFELPVWTCAGTHSRRFFGRWNRSTYGRCSPLTGFFLLTYINAYEVYCILCFLFVVRSVLRMIICIYGTIFSFAKSILLFRMDSFYIEWRFDDDALPLHRLQMDVHKLRIKYNRMFHIKVTIKSIHFQILLLQRVQFWI